MAGVANLSMEENREITLFKNISRKRKLNSQFKVTKIAIFFKQLRKMLPSTKYYRIIDSWYSQNVGEMYSDIEIMSIQGYSHRLKNIQVYLNKMFNSIFKVQNFQEFFFGDPYEPS